MFLALHMPDGFLPPQLSLLGWLAALLPISWAFFVTQRIEDQQFIPRMAMLAAFVFVAQMFQFPVPGGSSAHLQGSALAAIALGAWPAVVVVTCVVAVQGLILGEGGLLVMGWNLFNMAVAGVLVGSSLYHWAIQRGYRWQSAALAASWASMQFSSLFACLELAVGGTSPLTLTLPALGLTQALVGLGEGLATVGALSVLRSQGPLEVRSSGWGWAILMWLTGLSLLPPQLYGQSPVPGLGPWPVLTMTLGVAFLFVLTLSLSHRLWWSRERPS